SRPMGDVQMDQNPRTPVGTLGKEAKSWKLGPSGPPLVNCSLSCMFGHLKGYSLLLDSEGCVLEADSAAARLPGGKALLGRHLVQAPGTFPPCQDQAARSEVTTCLRELLEGKRESFTHDYSCPSTSLLRR